MKGKVRDNSIQFWPQEYGHGRGWETSSSPPSPPCRTAQTSRCPPIPASTHTSISAFLHSLPLRCTPLAPYPPLLSLHSMLDWKHRPSLGTVPMQQSRTPVPEILVRLLWSGAQPSCAFKGSQHQEARALTQSHGPFSHLWQASYPGSRARVPSPPLSGLLSAAGETQPPQRWRHYKLRLPTRPHLPARVAALHLVVFDLLLSWAPCSFLTPGLTLSSLSTGKQN